jgi:uncharacterized Ntn-hydrolase superfamily protein
MTYSIILRDPVSGELGVAVQTAWPMVGAIVPWVAFGVGAVATQSFAEIAYGPRLLERLRARESPDSALASLLSEDAGASTRQVAVVDAYGRTATHTGSACVAGAGHVVAEGITCQANMMERTTVPAAMLQAATATAGPLEVRLMAALRAAEAERGDIRGRQSAALVVSGLNPERPWEQRLDLRVDDHPAPLDELARLIGVADAYAAMDRGLTLAMDGDPVAGVPHVEEAALRLSTDGQILANLALVRAMAGQVEAARQALAAASAIESRWPEYLRRFAAAGHAPADVVEALLADVR